MLLAFLATWAHCRLIFSWLSTLGMEELSHYLIPIFQNSGLIKEGSLYMFSEVYNFKLNLVNYELNPGKPPEVILPC